MRSPSPCSKSSSPSPLISNVTSASAQSVSLSPTLRPSRIPQCVTPRTPALTTCVYILGISVCAHTWWGRNHRHEDGRRSTCHTRRGQIHVRHALTDSARPSSTPHGCCAHAGPHRCQKRRPGSKPTPPPNRRKNANMAALVPCSAASRSQPHQRRGRTLERAAPPAFSGNATAPLEVPAASSAAPSAPTRTCPPPHSLPCPNQNTPTPRRANTNPRRIPRALPLTLTSSSPCSDTTPLNRVPFVPRVQPTTGRHGVILARRNSVSPSSHTPSMVAGHPMCPAHLLRPRRPGNPRATCSSCS